MYTRTRTRVHRSCVAINSIPPSLFLPTSTRQMKPSSVTRIFDIPSIFTFDDAAMTRSRTGLLKETCEFFNGRPIPLKGSSFTERRLSQGNVDASVFQAAARLRGLIRGRMDERAKTSGQRQRGRVSAARQNLPLLPSFYRLANQSRLIVTSIFYELLLKEFRRDRTLKTRGEKKRESKEEGVGKAGCIKRLPSFVQVSLSDLSPALRPLNLPEKRSF